jgi:hypothetical protein
MRIRTISLLAALAIVATACGGAATEGISTTTIPEDTTTTTEVQTTPDAQRLSYSLEPGTSYEYEVGLDQQIEVTTEGDASALGDEEIPGNLSVSIQGITKFTHTVEAGPDPDTFEITITGDFTDMEVTGTMDGEPIVNSELPEFAQMDPVEVTVLVDGQGNVITPEKDDEFGDLFGGGLGDLESLGGIGGLGGSGVEFGHIGPQFPDEEVTVGDTWTDTVEIPMMEGDPVTTEILSEVVGTDTVDGAEVLVIETHSVTSMIEFDLAQFLLGFFMAFAPDSTEGSDDLSDLEDLRFLFSIDETVTDLTTWFDPEAGYARQADYSGGVHFVMDLNMPDDESGEMIAFVMDMSVIQKVTYRLTSADNA